MNRHLAIAAAAATMAFVAVGCGGGGGGGGTTNIAPVANAGLDQTVVAGAVVTLNGSGSSDANGDPLTYSWSFTSKPAGSSAVLSSAAVVNPTYTADLPGVYVLSLTVSDGLASSTSTVTIAAVLSNHVPDTGQTVSYTATFGEDADYTFNAPSYTPNGDGTVTDNVTGLVWQQQDDGVTRTWDAAATYCAGLGLPGTGWRLPAPYEIQTIVDFGRSSPSIDTAIFTGGRAAYHWTTRPFGATSSDEWLADFWDGGVFTMGKGFAAYVRCVRGDELGFAFHDNGNGTVTDQARGLTWQQADDGAKRTWDQALTYCEGLTLGGNTDWRLPNVKELVSIENFATYPVADLTFFPTTKQNYYWSSTTVRSATTTAWQASFLGGSVGLPGLDKATASAYVRCVRGQ